MQGRFDRELTASQEQGDKFVLFYNVLVIAQC